MKIIISRALLLFALVITVILTACTKPEQPNANQSRPAPQTTPSRATIGVGVYAPKDGFFYLHNNAAAGNAEITFSYGPAGQGILAVVGDWNGDGTDTPGLYDAAKGLWFLRNSNSPTDGADANYSYGPSGNVGWVPIAGDWDGDGKDTPGLYDSSRGMFFLRNSNSPADGADMILTYGPSGGAGWLPIAGDWDGDGKDTPGLYDPSRGFWFLRSSNAQSADGASFIYGPSGQRLSPVAGDWDGDGKDGIGLYDPAKGLWLLRNAQSTGGADLTFTFGFTDARPLVGRWR